MKNTKLQMEEIKGTDFTFSKPLADEFVSTHNSLYFRPNYWASFCDRLIKVQNDKNTQNKNLKL